MSDREHRGNGSGGGGGGGGSYGGGAPGKRSLVEKTYGIQRKAAAAPAADPGDAVDQAAASSGTPLDGGVRDRFESATGARLGDVSVHTGAESNVAAEALGARAYATGDQIHFASGQYDPGSPGGQHLIAHELTHTVQQRGSGGVQTKAEVSQPGDAGEREADRVADAIMAGTTPGPIVESTAGIAGNFLTDAIKSVKNLFTGGGRRNRRRRRRRNNQRLQDLAPPQNAPPQNAPPQNAPPQLNAPPQNAPQPQNDPPQQQQEDPPQQQEDPPQQNDAPPQVQQQQAPTGQQQQTEFGEYWVVPDDFQGVAQDAQGEQINQTGFDTLKGVWDQVKGGTANLKVTEQDSTGTAHAGFKAAILAKLGLLMSKPNGRQLIGDLVGGGFDVTIRPSAAKIYGGGNAIRGGPGTLEKDDKSSGGGGTTIIQIDPACTDNDIKVLDRSGNEISDPVFIFLGHEMIHARHNQLGHNRRQQAATEPNSYSNLEEEETIDTGGGVTENKLRQEHGLDQRYGHGGVDKRG